MRARILVSSLALLLPWPGIPSQAQRPVIHRIHAVADPRQDSVFQLGSTITLEVSGLGNWMRQREKRLLARMEPSLARRQARDLVLYINDVPLLNMPPLAVYTDDVGALPLAGPAAEVPPLAAPATAATSPALSAGGAVAALAAQLDTVTQRASASASDSTLRFPLDALLAGKRDKVVFQLRRTPDNIRYWNVLYKSPWAYAYPGKIGLGYADQVFTDLYPTQEDRTIRLELIQPQSFWLAGLAVLLLGGSILILALRSWLLRDTTGEDLDPTAPLRTVDEANPPFSLSRVQLAWWIFIILGSHSVIYCVTGVLPDISTTSLSLLGISAGTTVLSNLTTSGQAASALATAGTGPPAQSRGFLTDLLSDEHGVCIHRLQKLLVSLLMGCLFIRTVYNTVATPVWTANQTLLLAISSATYLGLKWQENSINSASTTPSSTTSLASASVPGLDGLDGSLAAGPAPSPAAEVVSAGAIGALPLASMGSLANPVTGEVIQREEDDMGPPDPSIGYVPSEQDSAQAAG
jgi:hypothetical protein